MSAKKSKIAKVLLFFLIFTFHPYLSANLYERAKLKLPISLSASVGKEIRRALEKRAAPFQPASRAEMTAAEASLVHFYEDSDYRPVWSDENGTNSQALLLIAAIRESAGDGLDIYDPNYNLQSILALMRSDTISKNNPVVLAELDILLTDAYMMLGRDLYYGLLPHAAANGKWVIAKKPSVDMAFRLRQALQEGRVKESLEQLSPSFRGYQALRTVMMRYLTAQEAGGWKKIESACTESEDAQAYCEDALKERLRAEGDLSADNNSSEAYEDALRSFQKRHGIRADGSVGRETLAKLNIELQEKIAAIRLNLERWRWMPQEMGSFYVSVNIPDFSLSVVDDYKTVLSMRAILGKETRETPIFNANMSYIVVNPYWHVPITVLREDMLPEIRKDIGYLKENKIRVFSKVDYSEQMEIDPATVDWNSTDADNFPYALRQDAGSNNAMGQLKFIFPNAYDIYIHDTPGKYLFDEKARTFSSGCIRIQKPIELVHYLLANDGSAWSEKSLIDQIARGEQKKIFLSKPVNVYIDYWTVWVDDEGRANFREDVYGYDRSLKKSLGRRGESEARGKYGKMIQIIKEEDEWRTNIR